MLEKNENVAKMEPFCHHKSIPLSLLDRTNKPFHELIFGQTSAL
jgi:hypothetical protein